MHPPHARRTRPASDAHLRNQRSDDEDAAAQDDELVVDLADLAPAPMATRKRMLLKFVIVGNSMVGKTSVMNQ
ncbi:hypothetical protein ZEAMMB73_Zm00001d009420 [Zea mays]|uniref:Uncharacterized protein n=1 Tax=Zea mays TaxID=4577 RepID=A0A1D6FJB6_MAIZE|nr:hypothetical protein ZEAMMB73_Zm00001d009420 [Zea mays]